MPFTTVAKVSALPIGAALQVVVGGRKVALFHCEDAFYALDDVCTHRGGPLSEGLVTGDGVECPWHGARFNLKTGAHLCPPASKGVTAYPVQVVGDDLQIDLP